MCFINTFLIIDINIYLIDTLMHALIVKKYWGLFQSGNIVSNTLKVKLACLQEHFCQS